jgi:Lecithin retinol acyltransferase
VSGRNEADSLPDEAAVHIAVSHRFTTEQVGFPRKFHVKGHGYDCLSRAHTQSFDGFRGCDRLLAGKEEPPLGAHLVTPRFAYAHHGVYVGGGAVVHYGGLSDSWRGGPVEEISLARFAHGHPVWVRPARSNGLQCAEIVRRARSRVGENRYRFFSNNCEHFSEWCVNGEHRSPQVERLLARLQCVPRALSKVTRLPEVAPLRRGGSPNLSLEFQKWLFAGARSGMGLPGLRASAHPVR